MANNDDDDDDDDDYDGNDNDNDDDDNGDKGGNVGEVSKVGWWASGSRVSKCSLAEAEADEAAAATRANVGRASAVNQPRRFSKGRSD